MTSSLKASCLDVHLRRRRLACHLLGLHFGNTEKSYWDGLCEIMDEAASVVAEQLKMLQDATKAVDASPLADDEKSPALVVVWKLQGRTRMRKLKT